ncbi:FAD-binding domain-containing protein [Lactarius quietus]|nr:FAD-binding domain-containing protein [Lactarius quietus]
MMLGAAFLGRALILSTLFASSVTGTGQLDFGAESLVTDNAQSLLGHHDDYRLICHGISRTISPASQVFYPGSRISACSVRPGTVEDLSWIVRELGFTRTPFAVKCSGHSINPGFSSTHGVQISMVRFRDIVLNGEAGTVEIGAGLTWPEVYSYLVPKGLNVVGGRLENVGVSGFTLGGGYSYKTNQYGLTIDTVTAYELVLPSGQVKKVTEKDEDLWFALRGIVTKFTLKTYKQTDVWAALLAFEGDQIEPAYNALSKWTSVEHDPKGVQLDAINYEDGKVTFQMILFYDGPKLPAGFYDDFLDLPNSAKVIIEGDFMKFYSSLAVPIRERAYFDGVPMLHYSVPVLKATHDHIKTLGDKLREKDKDVWISFNIEPFASDIFTHGAPSAYPPDRSRTILPSVLAISWNDESLDQYMYDSLRTGIKDGQDLKDAAVYTNYAVYGTPLEKMYGKNVKRLRAIKKKYDPFHVMDLAGGFKF